MSDPQAKPDVTTTPPASFPRYFVHVKSLGGGAVYVRFDGPLQTQGVLVYRDGTETMGVRSLDSALELVRTGQWREISAAEALALVVPAPMASQSWPSEKTDAVAYAMGYIAGCYKSMTVYRMLADQHGDAMCAIARTLREHSRKYGDHERLPWEDAPMASQAEASDSPASRSMGWVEAIEAAAQACEREQQAYLANSKSCDAGGNPYGATADINGALACKRCAEEIRKLPPPPGQEAPATSPQDSRFANPKSEISPLAFVPHGEGMTNAEITKLFVDMDDDWHDRVAKPLPNASSVEAGAEAARLRAALERIHNGGSHPDANGCRYCRSEAEASHRPWCPHVIAFNALAQSPQDAPVSSSASPSPSPEVIAEAVEELLASCEGRLPADSSDSVRVEAIHIMRLREAIKAQPQPAPSHEIPCVCGDGISGYVNDKPVQCSRCGGTGKLPAPSLVASEEDEAEEVHQAWCGAVAKLAEHFGIDANSLSWDPCETTEETVGNIVGKLRDALDEEMNRRAEPTVQVEEEFRKVRKMYLCPKCHNLMMGPMNLRDSEGGNFRIAWLCPGVGCGYEVALATPGELAELRAALTSSSSEVDPIREALGPVLDWFQSDEEDERTTVAIVREVAAQLESDRRDLLAATNEIARLKAGGNYIADDESLPRAVLFANGRTVWINGNHLEVATADDLPAGAPAWFAKAREALPVLASTPKGDSRA